MANRNPLSRRLCLCKKSALSYSSPLLFLSAILPKSSYAQLTSQLTSAVPTTLLTSTSSKSSPASSASSARPLSATTSTTDPNADDGSSSDFSNTTGTHAFNYYFVIVAIAAVIFCLVILYFGKRKKQKAALMRSNSQRALAQDVARFHPRTRGTRGRGNGRAFWNGTRREDERVEGLDERGEAPPPYVPVGKPPSIRVPAESVDVADARTSHADAVELSTLVPNAQSTEITTTTAGNAEPLPPSYHEHISQGSEDIGNISRPTAAVTTPNRHESTRRLLGSSDGSAV